MIRSAALIGVVLTLLAFCLGWCVKPAPSAMTPPVVAMRLNAPAVAKPGWQVKDSATYFARLNAPPPPPPMPKPAPSPPPDVAALLRAQLAAVIETPQGLRLLVASRDTGARQSKTLARGDVFLDGWRIANFDHRHAELRKGRELRLVPFFGPVPPPPAPVARPSRPTSQVMSGPVPRPATAAARAPMNVTTLSPATSTQTLSAPARPSAINPLPRPGMAHDK